MRDEILSYLKDIKDAIDGIEIHLGGKKDFTFFVENYTVKRAIERELEIVGEATNRILKAESNIELSYGKTIVQLRNRVIHGYDSVDYNVLWKIIVKDLPILKEEVNKLLGGS